MLRNESINDSGTTTELPRTEWIDKKQEKISQESLKGNRKYFILMEREIVDG